MKSTLFGSCKRALMNLLPSTVPVFYRAGREAVWRAKSGNGCKSIRREFLLDSKELKHFVPGIDDVDVIFPSKERSRPPDMVLPLKELISVGALCQVLKPKRIFEIGTYTGSTTLMMALNTPDDTEIHTLDFSDVELIGSAFRGRAVSNKIKQITADSQTFDFSDFHGKIDLVFVDGNHSVEFVKKDSESAAAIVRKGGMIIWDDYIWLEDHPECAGVAQYLDSGEAALNLFHLSGTRLALSK